jgi:alkylhydroperoxidase/carboxymuconolactone decarboxylase family protein YurZ
MAPEVFLWMELEGYGKVLSRPGLDVIDRELAIVACLMIEHRPAQLHSHIRGALNVGAPRELLGDVVSDLRTVAVEGYRSACGIIEKLGITA